MKAPKFPRKLLRHKIKHTKKKKFFVATWTPFGGNIISGPLDLPMAMRRYQVHTAQAHRGQAVGVIDHKGRTIAREWGQSMPLH